MDKYEYNYKKDVAEFYEAELNRNSRAHDFRHANDVCGRILDMRAYLYPDRSDLDKLCILAAYLHDLKEWISRKEHHICSYTYIITNRRLDPFLRYLSDEELDNLSQAVLYHRATLPVTFKDNILGILLFIADKDVPVLDDIVLRSLLYSGNLKDTFDHIKDKFSRDGYLKYPEAYVKYYGKERIETLYNHIDNLVYEDGIIKLVVNGDSKITLYTNETIYELINKHYVKLIKFPKYNVLTYDAGKDKVTDV